MMLLASLSVGSGDFNSKLPCSLQAFFVTSPDGLQHWVQTHPEYTKGQLTTLASTIADFKGLKKKDRQILLDLVETSILS